jgi:poly-beta-1,6-N-acetyl-D-glucosamine synthase
MGILFWASIVLVLYIYAGYPLLLVLLSRLRSAPRSFPEYLPTVTILIAAYNEEKALAGKLENTLSLEYPRKKLQVLVAADGSTDHTVEIVRSFADRGVELSHSVDRAGKMAAINRAAPLAWGEILILSDANNQYNADAIKALVAPFQDKSVGATGGAKHILEGDSPLGDSEGMYWKYESWIKKQETRLGCATAAAGEINALRRRLYVPPPPDTINDDFFLMMQVLRQGYRMVYVPEAKSSERISISEVDEIERRARIISGRYQTIARSADILPFQRPLWVWQIISHKFMRPLVPFLMILAFAGAIGSVFFPAARTPAALWLAPPWNWIALVSQIGFYLSAWIGKYAGHLGTPGKIFYLATFLVNSNIAALRGFWRYIRKTQTTQWKRAQRRGEAA